MISRPSSFYRRLYVAWLIDTGTNVPRDRNDVQTYRARYPGCSAEIDMTAASFRRWQRNNLVPHS
ncbi:hypothetical protein [Stutzerimonas xanthomarina]|uniref:hypothetical protein n=1 Tax=Stutzerimonas xanthomarina TaxID=271420 RepID=UPI003AA8D212